MIFDLGLSSIQLDDLDRGFSFKSKKNLDMAMGLNDISALDAINNLSERDLKSIIKILGTKKEKRQNCQKYCKIQKSKKNYKHK